jgi:hypothetical protein
MRSSNYSDRSTSSPGGRKTGYLEKYDAGPQHLSDKPTILQLASISFVDE